MISELRRGKLVPRVAPKRRGHAVGRQSRRSARRRRGGKFHS
jgi:hypothetical protein